jgi:hypothetical protein
MAIPFTEMEPRAQLAHVRQELEDLLGLIRDLNNAIVSDTPSPQTPASERKEAKGEA